MASLHRLTAGLELRHEAFWEHCIRVGLRTAANARRADHSWRSRIKLILRSVPKTCRSLDWIDLAHPNGYVRERALKGLNGGAANSLMFCLALRRLNDWVPQVRLAARMALQKMAGATPATYVVDALCVMFPTALTWGRMAKDDSDALVDLLRIEHVGDEMLSRIMNSPSGPMAETLSQAMRVPLFDTRLDEVAARAVQPAVRARAQRALLRRQATWLEGKRWKWTDVRYGEGRLEKVHGTRPISDPLPVPFLLDKALSDRSVIVRRVAAEHILMTPDAWGARTEDLALRLIADPSPSIAERGHFLLKRVKSSLR